MAVDIKQLETLEEQIDSTWQLLDIDAQITQMQILEQEMQVSTFWEDQEIATRVSRQHEVFRSEIETWTTLRTEVQNLLALAKELQASPDTELEDDIFERVQVLERTYEKLSFVMLFSGKHDKKYAIVTVTAGSGGTEAQDWAAMLLRMILRFAEARGWQTEILDESVGQEAGIKSATIRVVGRYAYGYLKSEHGTHRLVRISPFDGDAMRHTSFAGIEVIPEMEDDGAVHIDEKDLRIDTFMSSGKGGQSVNTTYSAIRIVHLPTGITVQCQNEKSQLQNKKMAMQVLQSRLQTLQDEAEEAERVALRGEYKSAEWGNQIRNYVLHPYKMVKDVRTRWESNNPEAVLDGGLNECIEAYLRWDREGRPERK
jgi:peptide chain release factor 2